MRNRKIADPSKAPWRIEYKGKEEAVIRDGENRLALVCPVHNAELIVNAVNAYNELREENARLRAALKPVLECRVISAMTAETAPGRSDYCAKIIEDAQRIYTGGKS